MKVIKQISAGDKNNIKSLTLEIENLVYSNVKENYPGNWDQGSITDSLFSDLKKLFHDRKIHAPGNTFRSSWGLYRLRDDSDPIFSDIAIIIQIAYHDGQTCAGVVYLNVGEKDAGKNIFSSLNKLKSRKLLSVAHHSQMLLYDYDAITGMAFPTVAESIIGNHPFSWNSWMPYTHAVTVPANLADSLDIKSTGLYKISIPFSYQLCYRYLYGLDLDYHKTALDVAAGLKPNKGFPKLLVLISVAHGGAEPNNEFTVDPNRYDEF